MIDLKCRCSAETFMSGDVAIINVSAKRNQSLHKSHSTNDNELNQAQKDSSDLVLAQIHGHMHVDNRWLKLSNKLISQTMQYTLPSTIEKTDSLPIDPALGSSQGYLSFPLFMSSRLTLSLDTLLQSGVILEWTLPEDMIPSYKGRAIIVNYYVSINVQFPANSVWLHFPLSIKSKLKSEIAPFIR